MFYEFVRQCLISTDPTIRAANCLDWPKMWLFHSQQAFQGSGNSSRRPGFFNKSATEPASVGPMSWTFQITSRSSCACRKQGPLLGIKSFLRSGGMAAQEAWLVGVQGRKGLKYRPEPSLRVVWRCVAGGVKVEGREWAVPGRISPD